jgi:hypothetical protein
MALARARLSPVAVGVSEIGNAMGVTAGAVAVPAWTVNDMPPRGGV